MRNSGWLVSAGVFLLTFMLMCAPGWAAVQQVFVSGQSKIYVDTDPTNIAPGVPPYFSGDDAITGADLYYSMLYDDVQCILVLFGNGTLLPDGENGSAYIYKLTGSAAGDRVFTEIDTADVGGVTYQNFNTVHHGLDPLVITLSKSPGSTTYNKAAAQIGDGSTCSVSFEFLDGNADGVFDSIRDMQDWGTWDNGVNGDEYRNFGDDDGHRVQAVLDGILQKVFLIDSDTFLDGDIWLVTKVWLPLTDNDSLTVYTADEVLAGMPRDTTTWVEPAAPGYTNGGGNGGGDGDVPANYNSTSDFMDEFCFVRSAHIPPYNPIHMSALRLFQKSRGYSMAALAGLFLVFFGGVRFLRRKGFGKGL